MQILAIHDNKSGHKSQINGILEYFTKDKVKIITCSGGFYKFLPVFLLKQDIFIGKDFKQEINKLLNTQFYPKKIIAVGKRTLPYVLYLKKLMPELGKDCKIIYLMPPSKQKYPEIDLTFFHKYKKTITTKKLIPVTSAPHGISTYKLQLIKKQGIFDCIKRPIISVFIGGDAKNLKFTKKSVKDLIIYLEKIISETKGTLLVSTSRRTNLRVAKFLQKELERLPSIYFNYYNNDMVFSGKNINGADIAQLAKSSVSSKRGSDNPYLAMLAYANYVIVSGESVSMISESCSLPKDVGVYIFSSKNFTGKRYQNFHKYLYSNNHAFPIADFKLKEERDTLNSTEHMVQVIKKV